MSAAGAQRSRARRAAVLALRAAAGLAAAPALLIGLVSALLALGTASSPPNPFNADPLFGGRSPDTWAQVRTLSAQSVATSAIATTAVVLLMRLAAGRALRLRPLVVAAAAGGAVTVLLISAAHLTTTGQAVVLGSCAQTTFDAAAFQDRRRDPQVRAARQRAALYLVRCPYLHGRTQQEVRRQLGDPGSIYRPPADSATQRATDRYWSYRYVTVTFDRGRVERVEIEPDPKSEMS